MVRSIRPVFSRAARLSEMKFPIRPLALIAAFLFSWVVVLPFIPGNAPEARPYAFELDLAVDNFATAQVFYDVGRGFSEADSVRVAVQPGNKLTALRFPLPAGSLRALRFDPVDRPAHVSFRAARITSKSREIIHRFSPLDFSAQQQISSLQIEGDTVRLVTTPQADDPILQIKSGETLVLAGKSFLWQIPRYALPVLGLLLGLLLAARLLPTTVWTRFGRSAGYWITWLEARPVRAVLLVATVAVTLSSYPVVFLGKSFVSPNFADGTYLLYEQFPTLPGGSDAVTTDANGSDVGAILWAHVPYAFIQSRTLLHEGQLPLWNRYNSCGTVLLGQGQTMFGDPLHLLVLLARGAAWAWDLKYLLAKFLLCGGLGLTVLHCTRHLPSAALAALSGAFLGFFIFRINHPAFFSLCYSPWILYAWVRIADAASPQAVGGGCFGLILANLMEMHSGTAKEAYMLLLGLNFSGICLLMTAARPRRERLLMLAAVAWTGLLFVLLTAPSWTSFLDTLKQAYTSYNVRTAFQIQPSVALGFFDEIFYRPLVRSGRVFAPSANFLVLIGVLYFLAAFRHAAASPRARSLAWSALPSLALVFGLVPPTWITRLPFLGNVAHIDNSFSCVLIILAVVLAGYGWRSAFTRLATAEGRSDLVRLAWLFVLLVWPWIAFTQTVHRPIYGDDDTVTVLHWGQSLFVNPFVWASLVALSLAAAVLIFATRRALITRRVDAAGFLFIALSLAVLLWRHGMQPRGVGPSEYVFTPATRADFHAVSPAIIALKADQTEPGRAVGFGGNLFPGWSSAYQIEGVTGPDALMNPYYRDLVQALGLEIIWDWRVFTTPANLAAEKPALDFLNVRHYLELHSDQARLGAMLTSVKIADLDVYRSESAWPRAFFSRGIVTYHTTSEFGQAVRHANGHPFAAMQADDLAGSPDASALAVKTGSSPRPISRAHDYRFTTNTTAFTVDADGPGIAVLHEAWLRKDFRVTVNGRPAEYVRVNHAFKGVILSAAGAYRIEFDYWPRHFSLALALSALGIALLMASLLGVWWLHMRPNSPEILNP